MAISKRGMRKLDVDGVNYLWKVRKADWDSHPFPNLIVLVAFESGGSVLEVDLGAPRSNQSTSMVHLPDGTSYLRILPYGIATPRRIAEAIRQARAAGWEPEKGGGSFSVALEPDV
ncbi:hypothetical protein [Armatimonas sp.]|uniref:hypothetical protein n=1 Tax=Armatimonas sp. TaxID=1872638 RepID=UPI00286B0163|nr:hypothetical protein [Armatimonas sp.]